MKATEFLPHLHNVQSVKPEQWKACCPAHSDLHPSLIIKETDDRLLVHCRAGCRTSDVLAAVGLDYSDLFLVSRKIKRRNNASVQRCPEPLPFFHWDWRKQVNMLEIIAESRRTLAEEFLETLRGISLDCMPDDHFDFLMEQVALARAWIALGVTVAEFVFEIRQKQRGQEAHPHGRHRHNQVGC